jgi:hypothetical protein
MHNPHILAKKYMDALQTFFPGLQVSCAMLYYYADN